MSDQHDEPTKILGDSDKETLTDRILRWAKNNAIIAILIVAVLTIGGIAGLSDSIQKLLLATHVIKSEALVLAEDSAKSDFSRRLTRNAWRRLFWARQYVERNRLGLPLPDQDIAWQKYYDATEDWNSELMIYIQALQAYYPNSGKRDVFESDIQVQFASIHAGLVALRFADKAKPGELQKPTHSALMDDINRLNNKLYEFVQNEPSRGR